MGTLTPGQAFDHDINPVKGWPSTAAVDKSLSLSAGVASNTVFEGACGHIDASDGGFKLGIAAGGRSMALFALQSADDFDANSDVGGTTGGTVSALVAAGSYEIETTEYETGGTYAVNTLLTANANGKVEDTVAPYVAAVVGVCSAALSTNSYGKDVLAFWPVYLPQT